MARSWLRELRRRHVFRVAAAYAVVGWLLIQIATQVFPFFHIPDWSVRLLVLLVLAGFPVALVLAWAFDATPQGIVRTDPEGRPVLRRARRGAVAVGMIGAMIAIAAGAGYWWWHSPSGTTPATAHLASNSAAARSLAAPAAEMPISSASSDMLPPMTITGPVPIEPKSIAVLPFENLSADPNNKYFAEGMQDMILTRLADIGDLKVISRTSTAKYASRPGDLKAVARQLAVANILEGSVQKVGNQVLINVQLIDAQTDNHLWAQAYTRTLDNVFGVEGEVAQEVAQALHATLTRSEQSALAVKPTRNAAAYDAYLRGLASSLTAESSADQYRRTAGFYGQAVQHDPRFALAWARLADTDSRIFQLDYDRSPALASAVKHAAETALRLAPENGESWLARGMYLYRVAGDFPAAWKALSQARARLPNNGEVLAACADIQVRQGKWKDALENIDRASVIDPRNTHLLLLHAEIHTMRREYPDALVWVRHARAIAPEDPTLVAWQATIAQAQGQLDQAQALLSPLSTASDNPGVFETRVLQWLFLHHYHQAIDALKAALAQPHGALGSIVGDYDYLLGLAYRLNGDDAAARSAWLAAQGELAALHKASPDDASLAANLGLISAGLGESKRALALGEQAVKLQPANLDAALGPGWEEQLARIEAQVGKKDQAIARLGHLLRTPYFSPFCGASITPSLLREDPTWNPLRSDPRFQALLKESPDVKPVSGMAAHG